MYYEQKIRLAESIDTPIEVLEELASDEWMVRCAIARNPNISIKMLEQLATDKHPWIRGWIAKNHKTPLKTLELLAIDKDSLVRECIIQNPNRTELIERLVLMTEYQLSTQPQNF
jgi:hypothetical protein